MKTEQAQKPVKQKQPSPPRQEAEVTWPLFSPPNPNMNQTRFWERKSVKSILPVKEELRFQSIMIRIGKKKKSTKGYFFRFSADGTLSYYKKVIYPFILPPQETDKVAKGYLQITMDMTAHLLEQKSKKETLLIIQIERYQGLSYSIFDMKPELTLSFFEHLKDYCVVSGIDRLYTQLDLLGKGSFASVFKVRSNHVDNYFAAKTYFKETFENSQHKSKFVLMIKNEIMVLRKVIHPGIIRLYEVIQEKDRLVLIMELVQGGDLYSLIKEKKKIPERESAYMLKGVCEALAEMHKFNFVHRDLKLENIMLNRKDGYDIKLVDFGFAEPINHKELVSKAGTPGYIPPEIFKLHPYTDKGDVFSVGVIFYSLISGISCFKGKNYQAVLEDNRKCEISFSRSVWNDVSSEAKRLLKKLLAKKAAERYSCADVLTDEWVLIHTSPDYEKADSELDQQNSYVTNRKSHYNSYESQNEFSNDFSYHTNDLKSFYHKNSQRTLRTQKSQISVKSNMKQSMRHKSASSKQQAYVKSQTVKQRGKSTGHQNSDDQKSVRFKNMSNDDQSFGKENDSVMTSISLKIFEDFQSVPLTNSEFLVRAQVFNLPKKPDVDAKVNEQLKKKKLQILKIKTQDKHK